MVSTIIWNSNSRTYKDSIFSSFVGLHRFFWVKLRTKVGLSTFFLTKYSCRKFVFSRDLDILISYRMAQFYYFLSIIPSPWLKKILRFNILKSSRMVQFSYFLSIIPSPPTVEENFEIWPSGKLQNGSIFYFLSIIHSPWLKKILRFNILKSSRMVQFSYFLSIIPSPWLKKILKFHILKSSRMA